MIDRATQERIKNTARIEDVVKQYTHLIKTGANYKALCPFHNERTPSFSINTAKNYCYCFSCKKGGSPINFLIEKEGMSYKDALRKLAEMYGIPIEERDLTDDERIMLDKRDAMVSANKWAMQKMESDLHDTEEGRNIGLQYFYQRGVTDEAIKAFHLGYKLDSFSDMTGKAQRLGYEMEILQELGLAAKTKSGGFCDTQRGRVIFPWMSEGGMVVGFGARTLSKVDERTPKYMNTRENDIFHKKNELYGIVQAKSAIRGKGKAFVVEGYMDVIGMWQAGIKNVVAACGTSFTDGHAGILKRHAKKVTMVFDGDAPGIKGAKKALNVLLRNDIDCKLLLLPDGHDPDSFARAHTPEEFQAYVEANETDFLRFLIKVDLVGKESDPSGMADAVGNIVRYIAKIPNRLTREIYVNECAQLLSLSVDNIMQATTEARREEEEELRQLRDINAINRLEEDDRRLRRMAGNKSDNVVDGKQENDDHSIQNNNGSGIVFGRNVNPTGVSDSLHNQDGQKSKYHRPLINPLEEKVASYLVKYGMLTAGSIEDEDGNESDIKVWEYIRMELENDEMDFSEPLFKRLNSRISELIMEYDSRWEEASAMIENDISRMRREGFDEIAGKSLDIASIENEERKLELRLELERDRRKMDFDRNYFEQFLINDEDDGLREFATSIVQEPYRLSNIYIKNGNDENDEERLNIIVPRAMIEWKTELIDQELKKLMARIKEASGDDSVNEDTILELQKNIADICALRSEIAKKIGDRIIAPAR